MTSLKRTRESSPSASSSDEEAPRPKRQRNATRANILNVFRRTLDNNIKILLNTNAKEVPRPLDAARFTIDDVQSIMESRSYKVPIAPAIPVWIAGSDEPILVDTISTRSKYAKRANLAFAASSEDAVERLIAKGVLERNPRRRHSSAGS
jgi:hypothetical protein